VLHGQLARLRVTARADELVFALVLGVAGATVVVVVDRPAEVAVRPARVVVVGTVAPLDGFVDGAGATAPTTSVVAGADGGASVAKATTSATVPPEAAAPAMARARAAGCRVRCWALPGSMAPILAPER
jgi:hypothetical protein